MVRKKGKNKTVLQPEKVQMGRGLDVGTAFVHCAQKAGPQVTFKTQRNAFFNIEDNEFVRGILEKSKVKHVQSEDKIYVVGDDSIKFANVFGRNTRRPLRSGVISPEESDALSVVELIMKSVLGKPAEKGEICYYSVPGSPVDAGFDTIYHQNIVKGFLKKWGYRPKPINEGLAVIFSELAEDDFTGMGISLGGGMANVCLAILSVPVFSFSVAKAGDWIDEQVAQVTGTPISKITTFKETSFDLKKSESNMTRTEQALSIYYNYLIEYVLDCIKKQIEKPDRKIFTPYRTEGSGAGPEFEKPIPMVISGGTAIPEGFVERFEGALGNTDFPLEIKEVRLASHPLYTVAKGALVAAIADTKRTT